ncbi:MAG: PhoX family protein [Proteobacteria bacterium]|nr:PhoX family protein [Pseudomonadota bacterium]
MRKFNRRDFLQRMSIAAAGTAIAPLANLYSKPAAAASAQAANLCAVNNVRAGFGPLSPALPCNTDQLGELAGIPLLEVPPGFGYYALSIRNDVMSDGVLVPGDHDGMACFPGGWNELVLVRNHELSVGENEDGNLAGCLPPNGNVYDPFTGIEPGVGAGGTTSIVINRNFEILDQFVSLGGTIRNCAGGPTPWKSWISCEETVLTPATDAQVLYKHGYNFEVPAILPGIPVEPIPLIDMGRFRHEATATDPRTQYIYQTEDRGDSCIYRFVPNRRHIDGFGGLQNGGDLYAMVIDLEQDRGCDGSRIPIYTTPDGTDVVDTRGLGRDASGSILPWLGKRLKVRWVKLDDVDPDEDTLRYEAQAKGAAIFWRGEGMWYGRRRIYFVCSGAGDIGEGQVWEYNPRRETVRLLVESTDENALDGPDNIAVGPDGTLYLCEDGSAGDPGNANFGQFVVGVDRSGDLFQFVYNSLDTKEFAGVCFSPGGRVMFVNSFGVGITYGIFRLDGRRIVLS